MNTILLLIVNERLVNHVMFCRCSFADYILENQGCVSEINIAKKLVCWSRLCGAYNISEDSRPHQIDHLCHLIDVDHALVLQLLRQRGEGAEHSSRHRSIPVWWRTKVLTPA